MKIAICDDDSLCRAQIVDFLSEYIHGQDISLSVYSSASALLDDALTLGGFDIYLLDVLMPGINGIQLGIQLRQSDKEGKILYLTSSREYAIDAFKAKASAYLLKPIQKQELYATLDDLFHSVNNGLDKTILVKTRESMIKLDFDSILYAELSRKTVVYHLISGNIVESTSIRSTFAEAMEKTLQDKRFILCGSNKLVNLHYISELDSETVMFKNGTDLYIGRRAARELRSVWYDFWFNEEVKA